jgi:LuxR family maltose regulon positive regulatory protein
MATLLLTTKLYIPLIRPTLVPRPRLIERLNAGLPRQSGGFARKLTLISAPAGFGKTTLVSEWVGNIRKDAEQESQAVNRIAWLSLDEGDNDLARFLAYFIAAVQTIEAGREYAGNIGSGALSALQSPQPPPIEAVLTSLINEIAAIPDRIVLVLDDYHLIEARPIHEALTFLLEHLPPQLHLIIATREDPHLPLARLRARGQLTELRATDLRFSPSEAAEFLNQAMGLDLSAEDIAALETRTEGWIAGLQLAAISLQGKEDTSKLIKSFSGSHRLVLDYLIEEVLDQQPEDIQTFLLRTAILNRLTGSLCDVITGQESSQATLEILDRANLFITPMDDERRWYRYHHLFADLLRQRLRQSHPEQIPLLHMRASEWCENNNLPSDAIRHALAAEDFERAASLAELAWPAWSEGYKSLAWLGWLKKLPDEMVRVRPVLSMDYAWAFLNAGKLEDADCKLKDVEQWLESLDTSNDQSKAPSSNMVVVDEAQFQALPASLASARAYLAQAMGDIHGTVKHAGQALERLPEDDEYNRSAIAALLGLAYWTRGDLVAACSTFPGGILQYDDDRIKGAFVVADIYLTLGLLHEAIAFCEDALRLAHELGEPMPVGTEDVYMGISTLHREQGDLKAAAHDLTTSRKLGEQVELPDWQYRWCIAQARFNESLGDLDAALDLLDEAERLYVRTPLPVVRPIPAMKARVWVKQGKLSEALGWACEKGLSIDDELHFLREFEHITLARILIAQHENNRVDGSIHEAVKLLDRLMKAAEEGQRTGSLIEILVLQALALQSQGHINSALKSLERAIKLAKPAGFFQLFVDEGPPMARLLYKALSRGIAPEYVRRLLSAFPVTEPEQTGSSKTQASNSELIEPLSERELEVLELLAEGLTNQEIASRLYISLNTVKVHTRNIYGKLGAHHRAEAVARARALGILHPT